MIKSYFDPKYPARDGRAQIPDDEIVASLAAKIIDGNDDLIWHAEHQGITLPTPNKSARINARRPAGMGHWVDVRASEAFFEEVRRFSQALASAGFH